MSEKQLGPYLIKGVLGRGGMGTVYRAAEEGADADVAVKVLSAAYADDSRFRSRFESEIQTLLKLTHPNIVRLIGHGEEDGVLFFAMELVEGQSLHVLQKSGHKFSWQEVVGIAMDVCAGLQHAHYRGIVHRDIKPANLIKAHDGTTKITDYGIAKLFGGEKLTQQGGAIGTADFMSPEQAQGELASERSDLFSLGCVMYALLTGKPPFAEKSVPETINALANKEPIPLRKLSPETPPEFEELINRLLRKKPEERFGTAQALNRRLVDLLEIIKAEADAQTAIAQTAVPLEPESDEYKLSPHESTAAGRDKTDKVKNSADTFADLVDHSADGLNSDLTVVEAETQDYFKVVERKKKTAADEHDTRKSGPVWPYALGMVAVLAVMFWALIWSTGSRLNADQLYEKITNSELPRKEDCDAFIERFPDDERGSDLRSILLEIESRKLEKQLLLAKKIRGIQSMSAIEIMLLDSIALRKDQPVKAVKRLNTLINIYNGDTDLSTKEKETLSSALIFRTRFQTQAADFIEKHRVDISRALTRAKELPEEEELKAITIYSAVILQFGEHQWAEDLVATAKLELEKHPQTQDQPNEND